MSTPVALKTGDKKPEIENSAPMRISINGHDSKSKKEDHNQIPNPEQAMRD